MRIAELLTSIASWLQSTDNEAVLLAEYHDECLKKTAEGCVAAAEILRKTAEEVDKIEPEEESNITPDNLEGLADIATAFDMSGDPALIKQAKLIDELLVSIAAPKNAADKIKEKNEKKIEELKNKYQNIKKQLEEKNLITEAVEDIKKSPYYKKNRPLEASLSTRWCPEHPGTPVIRINEDEFMCELDHKKYNFKDGFKLLDGEEVPGGSVDLQNENMNENYESVFDTRESRLVR